MKYIYRVFSQIAIVSLMVTVFSIATHAGRSQERQPNRTNRTVLVGVGTHLLVEKRDLRLGFYSSTKALDTSERRGVFLLIPDGVFEHAKEIATNDCVTVDAALTKYATQHIGLHYQTRVVQKNAIVQTPLGIGTDLAAKEARIAAKQAVLDIKLQGGDVIIVAGKE